MYRFHELTLWCALSYSYSSHNIRHDKMLQYNRLWPWLTGSTVCVELRQIHMLRVFTVYVQQTWNITELCYQLTLVCNNQQWKSDAATANYQQPQYYSYTYSVMLHATWAGPSHMTMTNLASHDWTRSLATQRRPQSGIKQVQNYSKWHHVPPSDHWDAYRYELERPSLIQ